MLILPGTILAQSTANTSQKCDLDAIYDQVTNPCGKKTSTVPKTEDTGKKIDAMKLGESLGEDKKPELDKSDEGAEKRRKEAEEAERETARQQFCKDNYGATCKEYREKREKECKNAGYRDCAQREEALKNTGGTGFKLNLDALTLTSNDQKSGKELFKNKEYTKKYGVVLGIILRIIDIMVYVIGSLAMITLIIAGLFMITNHGDDAWVSKGKTMMLYSLLGILFALLSFALVNLIQTALA